MKITKIQTIRYSDRPNLIHVQVRTDEGLTGLGETWFGTGAIEADIHERIAPMLIGADPNDIDALNRQMHPYAGFMGTGAELRALSAVDVALWDIAGKAAGKPLCDLLGGRSREQIEVYNTCAGPDYVQKTADVRPGNFGVPNAPDRQVYEDLDGFQNAADELAASLLEMGIQSMKIWPFDFADGAADGLDITAADMAKALSPFEKVRVAHGDKMRLKAELHGLWSLPAAKKICAALEPLDVDWVEDPIWMDRLGDLALLQQSTSAPLAGGETLGGLGQVRDLVESGGIDRPIIDVVWGGGVTFAKKAAALAEARSLPIAFHDCSGPVTLAVSTHLALHCRNVREQEMTRGFYYGWYHEIVDEPPPVTDGMITVGSRPGLGLELLPELLSAETTTIRSSKS